MSRGIGIFGGTFDPVHLGHIHASQKILDELSLVQLNLVPAHQPVHRDSPTASSQQRLDMLNLATESDSRLVIDPREISRQGPSYSLLTLMEYRQEYPEECLYFILGSDAVSEFHHWYQWHEFLDLVNLVILTRPCFELNLASEVEQAFAGCWQADVTQFRLSMSGQVYLSEQAMLTQSATEVRKALLESPKAQSMLSESVYDYIHEHKLYSKDLIE